MPCAGVLLALALLAADRPLEALPYTPGLDPEAMDRSVDPCVDFYAYACGGWLRRNPIPPDQTSWSVHQKAANQNLRILWGLLERAAAKPDGERTPAERKAGDFFHACMDEKAVEVAGAKPIAADLAAIDALGSKAEMARLVARLHLHLDGDVLFGFGSEPSQADADVEVAWLSAGGLGLPDRNHYVKGDARSRKIRSAYQAHVEQALRLSGVPGTGAAAGARAVMRIETALARASLTVAEKRDPRRIWNPTPVAELRTGSRAFRWDEYLAATGAPPSAWVNVAEPAFLTALERQLAREPLSAWKAYLRWHLVHAWAPYLSSPFQEANFAFYGAKLRGAREIEPRWKRCVQWTDAELGEALGEMFVARVLSPEVKADAEAMVKRVQAAMAARIEKLEWMSPETRRAAREKLAAMRHMIGHPAAWRDYSTVEVARDDFAGNVARATAFETRRHLAKIGGPVDRTEWELTPPSVDAYYDASRNEMVFPAGVLLPPHWDPGLDLAPGYGNTGAMVGHELAHGFDDEGRHFDARGILRDWWTPADAREFERRAGCLTGQYANYTVVDDVKIDARLTLDEDIADLAGILLAWDAWQMATSGQALEPRDGLTPEQRFFVGHAQWACANERPEELRLRAQTDPHSPPVWRVNGLMPNVPAFARAFACREGQPMVGKQVCHIW